MSAVPPAPTLTVAVSRGRIVWLCGCAEIDAGIPKVATAVRLTVIVRGHAESDPEQSPVHGPMVHPIAGVAARSTVVPSSHQLVHVPAHTRGVGVAATLPSPCTSTDSERLLVRVDIQLPEHVPCSGADVKAAEGPERIECRRQEAGGESVETGGRDSEPVSVGIRLLCDLQLLAESFRSGGLSDACIGHGHLRGSLEPDPVLVVVEIEARKAVVRREVVRLGAVEHGGVLIVAQQRQDAPADIQRKATGSELRVFGSVVPGEIAIVPRLPHRLHELAGVLGML